MLIKIRDFQKHKYTILETIKNRDNYNFRTIVKNSPIKRDTNDKLACFHPLMHPFIFTNELIKCFLSERQKSSVDLHSL